MECTVFSVAGSYYSLNWGTTVARLALGTASQGYNRRSIEGVHRTVA